MKKRRGRKMRRRHFDFLCVYEDNIPSKLYSIRYYYFWLCPLKDSKSWIGVSVFRPLLIPLLHFCVFVGAWWFSLGTVPDGTKSYLLFDSESFIKTGIGDQNHLIRTLLRKGPINCLFSSLPSLSLGLLLLCLGSFGLSLAL